MTVSQHKPWQRRSGKPQHCIVNWTTGMLFGNNIISVTHSTDASFLHFVWSGGAVTRASD